MFIETFYGEIEEKNANFTDRELIQSNAESLKADSSCQKPVTLLAFRVFCYCFYVGSSTSKYMFLLLISWDKLWKDPDPFVTGTDFLCVSITCIWNDLQCSKKPISVGESCRESCWDKIRVSSLQSVTVQALLYCCFWVEIHTRNGSLLCETSPGTLVLSELQSQRACIRYGRVNVAHALRLKN